MPGKFIVLEGIDGVGTTTQARILTDHLIDHGRDAIFTAEPTDGPIGRMIREAVSGRYSLGSPAVALLFAADRLDHLNRLIKPALADGLAVVSDRYLFSSLAYQSLTNDPDWVATINRLAPPADLVILLDAPAEVCLDRISARDGWLLDVFEKPDFLGQVRQRYLEVAEARQAAGERVIIINADQPVDRVAKEISAAVETVV